VFYFSCHMTLWSVMLPFVLTMKAPQRPIMFSGARPSNGVAARSKAVWGS